MITAVLIITLFYPRLGLIMGYYGHGIPPNPFPFWLDFWIAAFFPRVLVLVYISINWEILPHAALWIALHFIAFMLSSLANLVDNKD